jgi:dUTP pyrophosphatase
MKESEIKKLFNEFKNEIAEFANDIKESVSEINQSKIRGFEIVSETKRKFTNETITLPTRSTKKSAGYDFYSNDTITIKPLEKFAFFTDVKSYMKDDEYLEIVPRSSIGIKKDLALSNTIGVIDSDYYSNPENDGNIIISLRNLGKSDITIEKGERIAQGIFKKYLVADSGNSENERTGGVGSTNK